MKYWHFIEEGQLPRLSFSAQYLLYSVDVALDQVCEEGGARDWVCIEEELDSVPLGIQCLRHYIACFPIHVTQMSSTTLGFLEARQEKRQVYILSAFIEAHEHAQKKIHSFLGLDSNLGMYEVYIYSVVCVSSRALSIIPFIIQIIHHLASIVYLISHIIHPPTRQHIRPGRG
ncbi:hypothetical protein EON65_01610 [archaeon]|nr:MAG: hypothetical protein EON65_01610 [archaeon]